MDDQLPIIAADDTTPPATLYDRLKGGRPAKFTKLEQLVPELLSYFDSCVKSRTMPTKAGLCIWLHMHRDTYNEYKKNPKFSDALKATELYIEDAWNQRLAGPGATGAIFYLKAALQYREAAGDPEDEDETTPDATKKVAEMTPEQLDEYLRTAFVRGTA